jgi:hypothetical protein
MALIPPSNTTIGIITGIIITGIIMTMITTMIMSLRLARRLNTTIAPPASL